jgi:hypothetical protein
VYIKRAASWERLPGDAVLTEDLEGDEVALNPALFPPVAAFVPTAPPRRRMA